MSRNSCTRHIAAVGLVMWLPTAGSAAVSADTGSLPRWYGHHTVAAVSLRAAYPGKSLQQMEFLLLPPNHMYHCQQSTIPIAAQSSCDTLTQLGLSLLSNS